MTSLHTVTLDYTTIHPVSRFAVLWRWFLQLDLSVLVLRCDFDCAVIACKLGVSLTQSRMIKVALPFRASVPIMTEVGG
jgi:hypothetical protein